MTEVIEVVSSGSGSEVNASCGGSGNNQGSRYPVAQASKAVGSGIYMKPCTWHAGLQGTTTGEGWDVV